jgi:hypothetical protein
MDSEHESTPIGRLDPSYEQRLMPGAWDLSSMPGPRHTRDAGGQDRGVQEEMDAETGAERLGSGLLPPYFDPAPPYQHWGDLI